MLTEQQGLKTYDIISIAKDKKGLLWLASQGSVQRYDGKQAIQYLINETIDQVFADSKNRKWVIGRYGVYLFINEYNGFKAVIPAEQKKSPICVFEAAGILYLLCSDGILQYEEQKGIFTGTNNFLASIKKKLTSSWCTHNNLLFVSSGDSIYRVDLLTKELSSLPFKRAYNITAISADQLLVSNRDSQTWRLCFNNGEITEIQAKDAVPSAKSHFLRLYKGIPITKDRFLFPSNLGIMEYNSQTDSFHLPAVYCKGRLLDNNATERVFYKDGSGMVFMTHADGVAFFDPLAAPIHYVRDYTYQNESIPDIDVRSFAEDDAGNIWLGTINGIARLNMVSGVVKSFLPGSGANNFNYPSLRHLVFKNNFLWCGTGGKGVWLFNTQTEKFSRPKFSKDSSGTQTALHLNGDFIWKMLPLADGNVFIAGGSHHYLIDATTFQAKTIVLPGRSGVSRSAAQDSARRIWHGTSNGLACYDTAFNLLFAIRDSFPDKRVAALCEWKRDRMLIGTKGLYEVTVKGNSIAGFKKLEGIPDSRLVYCMEKDREGYVWAGTDEGLYRYNPLTGKAELFDAADNVQPQAFNSNGMFLSKNNMLFAGGKAGVNFFNPARIKKRQLMLTPWVAAFTAGNDDSVFYRQAGPYTLDYFNRSIVASISAPEYLRPFTLQYRYRINEKQNHWIYNGNSNIIRMNNLSPGSYQFEAAVSYDGQRWFHTADPVAFRVLKPWWQQWWFRAIALSLTGMLLWLLYRYKMKQRENAEHQKTIDYFANSGYEHSSADDILWDITRNCISRLGFEDCVIYILDEERQVLVQRAAYGAKSPRKFEIINPIEIPLGKAITGHVALTGIAEIIADTTKDKRYLLDDEMRYSEIVVPVIHNEKLIGVIDSENKRKNFFTKKHLETLQTIASICASKISLAMAVEKMQKAMKQVDEVHTKMMETKFMNLRLQMNPHFLFNSLSSIQHLVVSHQTTEAYQYLSVFSNFLRSILQYADKTFIALDDELKMLAMYIKLESLGFDKTFTYDIKVDEELDTEDIFIPPLIIQPLIENAIWHGLQHKEGEKYFSVSFHNNDDDNLVCTVEDNGIGRQEAAAINAANLSTFVYQSKATSLIRERLALLKQKTGKEASMTVEDKIDNNKATGTRISLIIPYYNNEAL
jgi:ligand-binding sensor domain-containing protein/putative methionine-R-sulfoxide reductase with GAF domain/two-component sensor histidine kinase